MSEVKGCCGWIWGGICLLNAEIFEDLILSGRKAEDDRMERRTEIQRGTRGLYIGMGKARKAGFRVQVVTPTPRKSLHSSSPRLYLSIATYGKLCDLNHPCVQQVIIAHLILSSSSIFTRHSPLSYLKQVTTFEAAAKPPGSVMTEGSSQAGRGARHWMQGYLISTQDSIHCHGSRREQQPKKKAP